MFYEKKIALIIWNVFSPILLIFGTAGNVTTIVLMQRRFRYSGISKYLIGVAVSDLLVLWITVPRNWIIFGYGIDLMSPLICKVQLYLLCVCSICSVCFVVMVTIEHFIFSWMSGKAKNIFTTQKMNLFLLNQVTLFTILNIHFIYSRGHLEKEMCYPIDESYANLYFYIWSQIVDAMSLIPLATMVVVNIYIITRVFTVKWNTRTQAIPLTLTTTARGCKERSYWLKSLALVYIICAIPFMVFRLIYTSWVLSHGNEYSDAVLELFWAIFNALLHTHNAVNSISYFISGSGFLKDVNKIFYLLLNSYRTVCQRNVHSRKRVENAQTAEENIGQ